MSEEAKRGMLTEAVQAKARDFFGKEITVQELRLIPYIQYLLVNEAPLDRRKINDEEIQIIENWSERGWVSGVIGEKQAVTESFWKAMNEIIWVGYVNFSNQALPEAA